VGTAEMGLNIAKHKNIPKGSNKISQFLLNAFLHFFHLFETDEKSV